MAKLSTLQDLFNEQLRDLYNAEEQIIKALPKMAQSASAPELRAGFEEHLRASEGHRDRVHMILEGMGQRAEGHVCKAMEGLLREGDEIMHERADPQVRDAALIAAAQRVEHYEMAGYGCVRTWANVLGMPDVARQLQFILDQEGETDKKLTDMAERVINQQAL
ncbi:MAG: ferritin-like domain-containing protein [Kouleothrix sp.]